MGFFSSSKGDCLVFSSSVQLQALYCDWCNFEKQYLFFKLTNTASMWKLLHQPVWFCSAININALCHLIVKRLSSSHQGVEGTKAVCVLSILNFRYQ